MLKYVDTLVSFSEVPDEISLCINISKCPCHCIGCHSPYLAEDIGDELNLKSLINLLEENNGITCVCLMGGDSEPKEINNYAQAIQKYDPELKVAWYSGKQELSKYIDLKYFNYIKLGPYIEELGPLNSKTTNQRFFKVCSIYDSTKRNWELKLVDITYKFQK